MISCPGTWDKPDMFHNIWISIYLSYFLTWSLLTKGQTESFRHSWQRSSTCLALEPTRCLKPLGLHLPTHPSCSLEVVDIFSEYSLVYHVMKRIITVSFTNINVVWQINSWFWTFTTNFIYSNLQVILGHFSWLQISRHILEVIQNPDRGIGINLWSTMLRV